VPRASPEFGYGDGNANGYGYDAPTTVVALRTTGETPVLPDNDQCNMPVLSLDILHFALCLLPFALP